MSTGYLHANCCYENMDVCLTGTSNGPQVDGYPKQSVLLYYVYGQCLHLL